VESLADRTPVEVTIDIGPERYPPTVEGAAYFVIAEALTNVAKYAMAKTATVHASGRGNELSIEVVDDGIGGADPGSGSGLRGLVDRLAALDGTMTIDSPVGGGTRISAQIPIIRPTLPSVSAL
jgi:signal transduction histidine kinase